MSEIEFQQYLESIGIEDLKTKLLQFNQYYKMLIDYNAHTNLTAITSKEEVYLKHFYDSSVILEYYDLNQKEVLDIGTGAGFPGMVIAILVPNSRITLVESVGKKTNFLKSVINQLKISNVEIINERIENIACCEEKFDYIVVRAVATINILAELSARYLKLNGSLIAMKANVSDELIESNNAIEKLKLTIKKTIKYKLPKEDSLRTLVEIEKIKKTPKEYPRIFSKIKKNPL